MAKVYMLKGGIKPFPVTWSLYRIGTGPGRCEGQGFRSVREAREFAAKYGHEIVKPEKVSWDGAK